MRIEDNHDEARFLATWALGEPIIVEGVGERLRERWSPDALSALHGDLEVPLVDTRSGQTFFRPLRDFLNGFRRPELRPRAPAKHHGGKKAAAASSSADDDESGPPQEEVLLKLKDWPASSDFAELLPKHYNDLMRALPLQRYTRREGSLNLAAALPKWCLPPDLGPKMYLGYGSLRPDGTFLPDPTSHKHVAGTCLHVDMADAVNICAHVEPLREGPRDRDDEDDEEEGEEESEEEEAERLWLLESGGERGGAVWDIWRASDFDTITNFLHRIAIEEGRPPPVHGIHDHKVYIDLNMRRRLEEEEGVIGYRFVQRQGDAVCIPAGCPHQVLNLRSAIKAAMDFVSPEHITKCLSLTEQFRVLPKGHARNEDPLGTKAILLHAVSKALSTAGMSNAKAAKR